MFRRHTTDEIWHAVLTGRDPWLRYGRSLLRFLPSPPRCKLCNAPFGGFGGKLMKLFGKSPWERNPRYCRFCVRWVGHKGPGGTEIEATLLFADVRGSTSHAEKLAPREYGGLINRFYSTATEVFVEHDAIIDQLVGDEAIGLFVPGYAGKAHAKRAIDAARTLVRTLLVRMPDLGVGVGIHTGTTFIGSVGSPESFTDFTALGDAVNTAARLASAASAGEVLVSGAARHEAGLGPEDLERRSLSLKGKAEPMDAFVVLSPGMSG
jgi:adenylate cyclase